MGTINHWRLVLYSILSNTVNSLYSVFIVSNTVYSLYSLKKISLAETMASVNEIKCLLSVTFINPVFG